MKASSISFDGHRNTSARMRSSVAFGGAGGLGSTGMKSSTHGSIGGVNSLKEEKDLDIPAFPTPQEVRCYHLHYI